MQAMSLFPCCESTLVILILSSHMLSTCIARIVPRMMHGEILQASGQWTVAAASNPKMSIHFKSPCLRPSRPVRRIWPGVAIVAIARARKCSKHLC